MGWKKNLYQAGKELMEGKFDTDVSEDGLTSDVSGEETETGPVTSEVWPPQQEPRPRTVIAKGTVIVGSVQAEGDLELYGDLKGDIVGHGDLLLCGRVEGNVTGSQVTLRGIALNGDLSAEGLAEVDERSVVEGQVTSQTLLLGGRIRGDITVSGLLSLQSTACVLGNVKAGSLTVQEGAKIQGDMKVGGRQPEL